MPYTANESVLHVWDMGSSNTGLDGNMTATLTRFPTSSTSEAATETVSIAEVGSGFYTFAFTPTKAYAYHLKVSESTTYQETYWDIEVSSAPTAATGSAAYCSEADVTAWVQMGDYTGTTAPTETQVLLFMQSRAAEIYSWMAEVVGSSAPGPSTYATTIDTSTDAGLALDSTTRMANAIGAAMDALESAGAGETPARSERVAELGVAYQGMKMTIQALVESYIGVSSFVANHYTEGRVTVDSFTSRTQSGLTFNGDTEW